MVMTPADVALPGDSRPRYDYRIFATEPGKIGGLEGGAAGSAAAATAAVARQAGAAAPPGACVRSVVGMAQCASGSWQACCEMLQG
jgi:hypothetical protein